MQLSHYFFVLNYLYTTQLNILFRAHACDRVTEALAYLDANFLDHIIQASFAFSKYDGMQFMG